MLSLQSVHPLSSSYSKHCAFYLLHLTFFAPSNWHNFMSWEQLSCVPTKHAPGCHIGAKVTFIIFALRERLAKKFYPFASITIPSSVLPVVVAFQNLFYGALLNCLYLFLPCTFVTPMYLTGCFVSLIISSVVFVYEVILTSIFNFSRLANEATYPV